MIESDAFVQAMQDMGVNFFTGVPDSILGGIIAELMDRRLYTPAVREDEAVAMAAGAYMGGKIPAVLMQNSGLGTSLNTLISLNMIYRQPCILIVSWRGQGGKDAPEHLVMGEPHLRSVANLQPSRQRVATRQFAARSPRRRRSGRIVVRVSGAHVVNILRLTF